MAKHRLGQTYFPFIVERTPMAEYPDQNNYVTQAPDGGSSEENFTIGSKRKYLMRQKEMSAKRLEHLAVEKSKLLERAREITYLMDVEEVLLNGANQALSTMDNYGQTDCAEQAPTESCAPTGNPKYRGW